MTATLQILLFITSIITFFFIISKIRKSQLDIQDAVVWIMLALALVVMSIGLPFISYISRLFGFMSTSNFVFALFIFFLLIIVFGLTVKISILNEKVKNLNHYIALQEKKDEEE